MEPPAMIAMLLAAAAAASPGGSFLTEDGSALVRVGPCGNSICGEVAKVLNTQPGIPATDVHNPNPQLRSRTLVGLPILSGFSWNGRQWTNGQIYDPKTGRTYRSKLAVNPDGSLAVSGCVLFICESQRWRPAR
jgi:uncharacterized protein (DUF2147 family)